MDGFQLQGAGPDIYLDSLPGLAWPHQPRVLTPGLWV